MKKFLAILLIAIVVCTNEPAVEEEVFDFKALVKKAVELLKENGLWDPLVALLKKLGLNVSLVDENGEPQLKLYIPPPFYEIIKKIIYKVFFKAVWEGGKWVARKFRKIVGHK